MCEKTPRNSWRELKSDEPINPPAISSAPAVKRTPKLISVMMPPKRSRKYEMCSFAKQRYVPKMMSRSIRMMKLHPKSAFEPFSAM